MKKRKYGLLLMSQLIVLIAIAQIQTGTPWMNQQYQGIKLDGNGQEFIRQAEMHAQQYDIERATLALDDAVNFAPNSVEALVKRATFNRRIGRMYEADLDIERVNQLNPYAASLYGFYGHESIIKLMAFDPLAATYSETDQEELRPYLRLIDQKANVSGQISLESDMLYEIVQDIEVEKYEEGLHLVEAMITMYPESALCWDLKGVIHEKTGQNQLAKEAFSQAIVINESFAIAWYNLARLANKEGNNESAKLYLDRAISLEQSLTEAYFERALTLENLGDKEGAINDYNSVIDQQEMSSSAFANRGLTKKVLGDFSGALSDLDRAIAEQPDNALLYKNRANLMLLFGHYKQAILDYTKAIKLDDKFAEAYYNRGLTLLKINQPIEACSDFSTSAQLGFERAVEKQHYFCNY